MDLTLRVEYLIEFCMRLIAVISHDNYYNQFLNIQEKSVLKLFIY
jgi:hypothetical protein